MPTHSLNVFSVPSMSDIGTLLKTTKSSSHLDPITLSLLHEITESLTIPLNNIFCESLKSGTFRNGFEGFTGYIIERDSEGFSDFV